MTPQERITELITTELEDAMRHDFSEIKIRRAASERAAMLAASIIDVIVESLEL